MKTLVAKLALVVAICSLGALAQITPDVPARLPSAIVDLTTREGVKLVNGQWRYADASIVPVAHRAVGLDFRASGAPNMTNDIAPHAGAREFDDSAWQAIEPEALDARRGNGRLSFAWYRINLTIPPRVASFDTTGSTAVFEITVDDYAEIWVNGQLPLVLGQTGGPFIKGFNAANRVVLSRNAQPGQQFQIAVFAANGPLSSPPANFIWIREATLDFYKASNAGNAKKVATEIVRLDPAMDQLIAPGTQIEKLAEGFFFTEGPVWHPDGYLLFSDPNANTIYRWSPDGQVSEYRAKSGYTGADIIEYRQPGSNGLTVDSEGRLIVDQHGNRRVIRIERNGQITVLADRFEGKRLNSPNDLVLRSDGALFFTDPPFGLPKFHDDPRRELGVTGVFSLRDGVLRLVSADLAGPNGIAFSPNERYLYVTNWDEKKKVVMRYEVAPDATLRNGKIFFDMTNAPGEEALDGMKVDERGNLYVSGPGGAWVISPDGEQLGMIKGPELAANFAWGDDGKTLYMTARTGLYRIRTNVRGAGTAVPSPQK